MKTSNPTTVKRCYREGIFAQLKSSVGKTDVEVSQTQTRISRIGYDFKYDVRITSCVPDEEAKKALTIMLNELGTPSVVQEEIMNALNKV